MLLYDCNICSGKEHAKDIEVLRAKAMKFSSNKQNAPMSPDMHSSMHCRTLFPGPRVGIFKHMWQRFKSDVVQWK